MRNIIFFTLGLLAGFALAWKLTGDDRRAAMRHWASEAAFARHTAQMDSERRQRINAMSPAERADYEARMAVVRKQMQDEGIDTEGVF